MNHPSNAFHEFMWWTSPAIIRPKILLTVLWQPACLIGIRNWWKLNCSLVSVQAWSCTNMVMLSICLTWQLLSFFISQMKYYNADQLMSDVNRADSWACNYGGANCLILSQVSVASSRSTEKATVQLLLPLYTMASFTSSL